MKNIVWTIAGSDCSAGAGLQADLQTFKNFGVYGCSIVTAVTAQNASHISHIQYITKDHIQAQITALNDEMPTNVIKIGMLGQSAAIDCLTEFFKHYSGKIILDPVLVSTSGTILIAENFKEYSTALLKMLTYIDLFTPNIQEAEALLNISISSYDDIVKAAQQFLALGVKSIVIKGGHFSQDKMSQDYWTNGKEAFWLANYRYPEKNYRGTGCIFASAIAANLALGYEMRDALVIAKMYVNRGIRLASNINTHAAFLLHENWYEEEIDLPYLSQQPFYETFPEFVKCGGEPLGLYPIVDHSDWLKLLLPLGVSTIQLRLKNKTHTELESEILKSVQLAKQYKARLFINDYWELAIKYGAYGVHLGQEDLQRANLPTIHQAGLRLGISTHCYYEVASAHAFHPSYIACGPIYPTMSKKMGFAPQGLSNLKRWRRTLKNYQIVGIGGIDTNNISDVAATGVDGIALISAITKASNPYIATQALIQKMEFARICQTLN